MEELRFEHMEYLSLLAIVPLMLLLFVLASYLRQRDWKAFGDISLLRQLAPEFSKGRLWLKMILAMLAFTFLILALANPLIGKEKTKAKKRGIDVMVAIDVSKSMMAEDVAPSRLLRARQFVSNMLDKMKGNRVGLIVFAGNAYLQMPLTADHSAAKLFLRSISPEIVPTQGTAIADAIRIAREAFEKKEKRYKALIIITDGEDHEGDVKEAVKRAREEGIVIYTIGVGSSEGAPIPDYSGSYLRGYKKDKNGNIIISKLNQEILSEIALLGGGNYYQLAGSNNPLPDLLKELDTLDKKELEEVSLDNYVSYYRFPLTLGLIFLLFELLLSPRRARWWRKLNLFE